MALPGLALAFGANLLSGLLQTSGERKRMRRLRQEEFQALGPLEALIAQNRFGGMQSESDIESAVTRRVLGGLGRRGVLNSSMAPGEVAAAVAPVEERRQARRQSLAERLAAARQAIYAGTQQPGYEGAFAGTLGEFGGLMALLAGQGAFEGAGGEDMSSLDVNQVTPPNASIEDFFPYYGG